MTNALWIDRPDQLAAAVDRWLAAGGPIALDTEFVFERTYRPQLGIVQVSAAGEIAEIDAVRIRDLSALAPLLGAAGSRKILHSGSGDVPILRRAAGAAPRPLFDTQVAAVFAGLGTGLSYATLVKTLLGVELGKHETRTDWLRRPLSPEQIRYAAEDVEYLPAAAAELERRLVALGRLEWALEDSATLAAGDDAVAPEVAWRRVKAIDRLPPRVRAVARALAAWREREAARLDLARPFLLRDETLIAIAKKDAIAPADIGTLPGYDPRRHAAHTTRWREALEAARAAADAGTAPEEDPRLPAAERERRDLLDTAIAALVVRRANELELPAEALLSRRQRERALDAWDGRASLAAAVGGFRGALLGAELDALAGAAAPR